MCDGRAAAQQIWRFMYMLCSEWAYINNAQWLRFTKPHTSAIKTQIHPYAHSHQNTAIHKQHRFVCKMRSIPSHAKFINFDFIERNNSSGFRPTTPISYRIQSFGISVRCWILIDLRTVYIIIAKVISRALKCHSDVRILDDFVVVFHLVCIDMATTTTCWSGGSNDVEGKKKRLTLISMILMLLFFFCRSHVWFFSRLCARMLIHDFIS